MLLSIWGMSWRGEILEVAPWWAIPGRLPCLGSSDGKGGGRRPLFRISSDILW